MHARIGKIARLPGALRHELNRRLHNGALAKELVPWLNTLPAAQSVLTERFAGRPITEDNLSEWRKGGFQDWLLQEERRVRLRELSDECPDHDPVQRARRLSRYSEERLVLELTEAVERLSAIKDREERSQQMRRLIQEFCRLQRAHTNERYLRLTEAKAADAFDRAFKANSNPDSNQFKPESELIGPTGTNDHRGEGAPCQ